MTRDNHQLFKKICEIHYVKCDTKISQFKMYIRLLLTRWCTSRLTGSDLFKNQLHSHLMKAYIILMVPCSLITVLAGLFRMQPEVPKRGRTFCRPLLCLERMRLIQSLSNENLQVHVNDTETAEEREAVLGITFSLFSL